jgi:hypothetical protein
MILKSAIISTYPAHRRILDFTLLSILSDLYFTVTTLSMIAIDWITGKSEKPCTQGTVTNLWHILAFKYMLFLEAINKYQWIIIQFNSNSIRVYSLIEHLMRLVHVYRIYSYFCCSYRPRAGWKEWRGLVSSFITCTSHQLSLEWT